jgi:hypothetical protein
MINKTRAGALASALILAVMLGPPAYRQSPAHIGERHGIRHVLLISIDGMHPLDYVNCANGISGFNGGSPTVQTWPLSGRTVSVTWTQPLRSRQIRFLD